MSEPGGGERARGDEGLSPDLACLSLGTHYVVYGRRATVRSSKRVRDWTSVARQSVRPSQAVHPTERPSNHMSHESPEAGFNPTNSTIGHDTPDVCNQSTFADGAGTGFSASAAQQAQGAQQAAGAGSLPEEPPTHQMAPEPPNVAPPPPGGAGQRAVPAPLNVATATQPQPQQQLAAAAAQASQGATEPRASSSSATENFEIVQNPCAPTAAASNAPPFAGMTLGDGTGSVPYLPVSDAQLAANFQARQQPLRQHRRRTSASEPLHQRGGRGGRRA